MRLSIQHGDLHVEVEGDLPDVLRGVNEFLTGYASVLGGGASSKPQIQGLVEFGLDGMPKFTADLDSVGNKEKIASILYAKDPTRLTSSEIADIFSKNFSRTDSKAISAYLATSLKSYTLSQTGTDGKSRYGLTDRAKRWVENEILPKVRQ